MNKIAFLAFVISPLFSIAQNQGIFFEHNLTWSELLQKAQKENKYVFVDCYATWCGPCKMMDKDVYAVDSVGQFMNERFISVKMQMDSVKQDNEEIRQWYGTVQVIGAKYHIAAYPSYLFFSPDGEAVHKDLGDKSVEDFLSMAKAAMDPEQQYYTLLSGYRKGKLPYSLMPVLVNAAQRVGQDSLSKQVSRDYIHRYLETLPETQLWTEENILFVRQYSSFLGITDEMFRMFYRNKGKIDSVMHDRNFSAGLVNEIIYRDDVKPIVDKSLTEVDEPDWRRLEKAIAKNYDFVTAQRNVLQGQVIYYQARKKWEKYIKHLIRQQELNGIESWQPNSGVNSFYLNNNAYEVFLYGRDKRDLEKALGWVNRALTVNPSPDFLDTKANLLYKLGKKSDGLSLEEQSHSLSPRNIAIAANYEKMKKGQPTWPTK